MREHYRSPMIGKMAEDQRRARSGYLTKKNLSTVGQQPEPEEEHVPQNEDDEPSYSGVVKIGSEPRIVGQVGLDEIVEGAAQLALSNLSSIAASSTPESLPAREFQVTLRADQLARLWLREPTLTANNVFAWSSQKGKWVPALSLSDVSREITRARVDRMRMLSVLNAAQKSVTLLPPSRPRHRNLLGPSAAAESVHSRSTQAVPLPALAPSENEPESPCERRKPVVGPARTLTTHLTWLSARASHWIEVLRAKGSALMNYVQGSFRPVRVTNANWLLAVTCCAIVTIVPLGIRQAYSLNAAAKDKRNLAAMENLQSANVKQLAPVLISRGSEPDSNESLAAEPAKAQKSQKSTPTALSSPQSESKFYRASVSRERPMTNPNEMKSAAKSSTGLLYAPFEPSVAERAINLAAARAGECTDGDVYGSVALTFLPSGYVRNVQVSLFTGDTIQRICITDTFQKIRVGPFAGAPVTTRKSFHLGSATRAHR